MMSFCGVQKNTSLDLRCAPSRIFASVYFSAVHSAWCTNLNRVVLSRIAHFAPLYAQNMKLKVKTEASDLERTFRF